MRAIRLAGILAIAAVVAVGVGLTPSTAGAITQQFGTTQGANWVIGSYYRDGTTAAVPNSGYATGGGAMVYAQLSNAGNIARLAVGYSTGPCARALGSATGVTWGDSYCFAV
jgi:hypothetical protein